VTTPIEDLGGPDRAMESLLAFWAGAGADACFVDEPVNHMLEAARPPKAVAAAPTLVASTPGRPGKAAPDISAAVAEARRLASQATDLESLAAAVAAFDGCPLKFEGARQAVFGRGNASGDVIVIGECPGADEDVQGLPFVGRAGKLLDKMLAAAGLTDRVYITNTVYWHPPGNRTPTLAEQAICQPFVDKAISLIKPQYLLLAGGASAKSILQRDDGILTLRGRWFEWTSAEHGMTLPALPTLHPAFLLRQPAAKKKAWSDVLTLAERLDRPERGG
jgi:uracil-DNA glycosylase family 4